jgi:hypothetical protein
LTSIAKARRHAARISARQGIDDPYSDDDDDDADAELAFQAERRKRVIEVTDRVWSGSGAGDADRRAGNRNRGQPGGPLNFPPGAAPFASMSLTPAESKASVSIKPAEFLCAAVAHANLRLRRATLYRLLGAKA